MYLFLLTLEPAETKTAFFKKGSWFCFYRCQLFYFVYLSIYLFVYCVLGFSKELGAIVENKEKIPVKLTEIGQENIYTLIKEMLLYQFRGLIVFDIFTFTKQ